MMTKEQFVDAIKQVVHDSTVSGTEQLLRHPPGRKPDAKLVRLSEWFNSLPDKHKQNVIDLVTLASDQSVFGFLCVLDGVRQIENEADKGKLKLQFEKNGSTVVLNDDSGAFLHDLFKQTDG